jgi:hypothetical protein
MKIYERLNAILNDPSASYWLKDSLRSALRRDPIDAVNDAEILAEVLLDRCEDLTRHTHAMTAAEFKHWNENK